MYLQYIICEYQCVTAESGYAHTKIMWFIWLTNLCARRIARGNQNINMKKTLKIAVVVSILFTYIYNIIFFLPNNI